MTRTVFFISDGTGITAETLGRSLVSQFETIPFNFVTIPYVNNTQKATDTLARIEEAQAKDGERPIIFATLIDQNISAILQTGNALVMDLFQTFINPLETELGHKSSHTVGRLHGVKNYSEYMSRINAVNYALAYDDGANTRGYHHADVILIGVSRSGKTPTCLYLALQFGIFAANYPITEEDMQDVKLPNVLAQHKRKIFGLSIDPVSLQRIRHERLPNQQYATLARCQEEVKFAEKLFRHENIPFLDTTSRSIEEIAAEIMITANIKRRLSW